jgi:aryl-alcohol dehydrogenase-like predicted oxidoreductase
MKYRVLGRTGLKVSELGLGGHEFARFLPPWHFTTNRKFEEPTPFEELEATQTPRNELIQKAIEAGVNYFDTGAVTEPQSLGLALDTLGRRKDVYVAAETMGPIRMLREIPKAQWRDALMDGVDERLRLLRMDHIDVFNAHAVAGGYSRDRYDCFDSVMIPYNYHLWEARDALFPLCKALNIGVVVMKPFNWPYYGLPFTHLCPPNLEDVGYTPAQTSLKWILTAPEVSTIVPGTNTLAELTENLATFTQDHAVDETILKRSLTFALSTRGKERLKKICADKEIARTLAYIRGYSKRALTGTT